MPKSPGAPGRGVALLSLALALAWPALGLDPRLSVQQYLHTKWTQNEGKPLPMVNALAQTADGYLWLGTNHGLLRFDGLRFSKPDVGAAAGETVMSLAASDKGGLWIGTRKGLARLEGRRVSAAPGYVPESALVIAVLEDRSGRLWVGARLASGTATFGVFARDSTISIPGEGLPPGVGPLSEDRQGSVWATSGRVYSCGVGEETYRCAASTVIESALKEHHALLRAVLRDNAGNLWVGTLGQGLFCLRDGTMDQFTERDGLSSDVVVSLVEDHEGNIWVGTANGLDRLREPKVARWSGTQGLAGNAVSAVRATNDGDLWVGMLGAGLDRLRQGRVTHVGGAPGIAGSDVMALIEDGRRRLWAGTTKGVMVFDGRGFMPVTAADGTHYNRVFAFACDSAGVLWLADAEKGLASVQDGRIVAASLPDLPAFGIHQLVTDRDGNLWVGYAPDGLAVVRGNSVVRYSSKDGMAAGTVQALLEDSTGAMWVGTTEGISRYRHGAWTTWTQANGLPPGGVQGIAEDRRGSLWLVTRAGVAPLKKADLERAVGADTRKPPALSLVFYGPNDGIRMPEAPGMFNPRVATTPDGRIWVATLDGLGVLDPSALQGDRVPPPVAIEQLTSRGQRLSAGANVPTHAVEIDYTALSLGLPEMVRFRYRLEPLDSGWVDAGTRREIAYASLAPGHYRFRMTARDEDGNWNPAPAAIEFTIQPAFYQTWAFWGLCAFATALMVYTVHKARMRRLRERFQIVLQERSRLTREMHDTLLQGFVGVVYQLEAANRQMDAQPAAARRRLVQALEQADKALLEARKALSSMRMPELENNPLPEALRRAGERIVDGSEIGFEMEVTGRHRELPYDVQANLFVIAREAINNAVAHARPERIRLHVDFRGEEVALAVKDDGAGFELEQSHKPDHWGLSGMEERARTIGAEFAIHTAPGSGTTVEVKVVCKK